MAGISAARNGAKTVLIQDRPMPFKAPEYAIPFDYETVFKDKHRRIKQIIWLWIELDWIGLDWFDSRAS